MFQSGQGECTKAGIFFFLQSYVASLCVHCILLHWNTNFLELELRGKKISQSFSYCELINSPWNGTKVRCLEENKKMFLKWRHNHSQSPVFGLAVLYHNGSEIWLLVHQNTWKENRYRIFFSILISTLRRFYQANANKCVKQFFLQQVNQRLPTRPTRP